MYLGRPPSPRGAVEELTVCLYLKVLLCGYV